MYKIRLNDLYSAISKVQKLYIPELLNDHLKPFVEYKEDSSKAEKVRTFKDFFFPQTENLMGFKVEGKTIEVIDTREEKEDFTVFGVRACDTRSLDILDRVFLVDPVDTYYKNRREHGTVISVACTPDMMRETCFCNTFGIDCADPNGDICAYIENDDVYLEVKTEKGNELIEKIKTYLAECEDTPVWEIKTKIYKAKESLPLNGLNTDGITPDKMNEYFKSE